ncbi:hypothetical protein CFOL_v3_11389 [Cephalotus follicularis]|uniref:AIPP2-like SPOC-like domain-containing protein n=1 Tax=Cephalotus follicularis TaxID=3775 RepID=A0A1Q3BIU8_CEPFO|nr:hypothetical protein CFOL_v3_11389 [Cephalotus follicularis]
MCGDRGFWVALIYCYNCQVYAIHRYCLDVLPQTFDEYVIWFCDDCESKVANPSTLDKPSSLPVGKSLNDDIKTARVEKTKNRKKFVQKLNKNKKKKNDKKKNGITVSFSGIKLQRHQPSSSPQLVEVHDSENYVKDQNLGREKVSDSGSCTEEVESVEKMSSQVLIHESSNISEVQRHDSSSSIILYGVHCHENYEEQKLGRSIVGNSIAEVESVEFKNSQLALCVQAQPVMEPIWRGTLSICKRNFGGRMVAHLSTLACSKVSEVARLLPELLHSELLPRYEVWPKPFDRWGPTDYNIALYFFPDNERDEKVFDILTNDMIGRDLAMRAIVENAELLIFPSNVLPLMSWRFKTKFYLWGLFRGKQASHLADHAVPAEKDLTKALTWDTQSPISPLSNCGSYGSGSTMYSPICPTII